MKYRIDGDALPPGYVGQPIASCEADMSVPGQADGKARDRSGAHLVLNKAIEPCEIRCARARAHRKGEARCGNPADERSAARSPGRGWWRAGRDRCAADRL